MNSYPVESVTRLSITFTDPNSGNAPVDPSTVTVTITPPLAGPPVAYSAPDVVRDGTGAYHYDLFVTAMGVWLYRWQGLGAVVAATGDQAFQAI